MSIEVGDEIRINRYPWYKGRVTRIDSRIHVTWYEGGKHTIEYYLKDIHEQYISGCYFYKEGPSKTKEELVLDMIKKLDEKFVKRQQLQGRGDHALYMLR